MKSPVSQTKVIVVADRVIAIGGLPPSASTVSRRCQIAGGCGVRIVMRWTAGSMPPRLHERMFARVDPVEPGLQRRLARRGVHAVAEEGGAEADDAAEVVAPEEAVQAVARADAEELGRG